MRANKLIRSLISMDYPAVRDLDYDPVANWTLGFADSTKRQYIRFLKLFCEFTGKDPFQLMRWVKKDRTRVHQKLKEFDHHMAKFNVSPGNKNYGYIALRSFFFHNDYPLGKAPRLLMSQSRFREPRLLRSVEVGDMESRYSTCEVRLSDDVVKDMRESFKCSLPFLQTLTAASSTDDPLRDFRKQLLMVGGFTEAEVAG